MLNIGKLNLFDTDAVKVFIYDILVENRQLRAAADAAESRGDMWYREYDAQRMRADKAEGQVEHLKTVADSLAAERDAAQGGAQEGGADW